MINAISSPVSASGLPLCARLDGRMIAPSGPEAVPASLSASRAKAAGLLTSGICGLPGTGSSNSVALQSSLASRLRASPAFIGSTLFRLTLKERVTPSGRPIWALRASAHRTSDSDCGSWASPTANEKRRREDFQEGRALNAAEALGPKPTGSHVGTASGGQLNPEHSRWLMGLPPAWDACAVMATLYASPSRKRSSKPR